MYQKDKGFTLIETIGVLAIAIIIAVVAIFIGHIGNSPSDVILSRQRYIDKYISHLSVSDYNSLGTTLYHEGYITTTLYQTTQSLISSYSSNSLESNPSYSQIICVDEIPHDFTYGAVNISNNKASVPVNLFLFGSFNPIKYTAYWVNNNGTWQLNNTSCKS